MNIGQRFIKERDMFRYLLLSKRLPEAVFFLCKKYFKIFRHIRNAKIKFQNKEEKEMGDYVYGSGEVTLKKELSAVNFSQIQEGLKKKKTIWTWLS